MTATSIRRHNRPWTASDLKHMRKLARAELSARQAAPRLGRTTGSVKHKAMIVGVRFHSIEQPRGVQQRRARRNRRSRRAA